MDNVSLHFLSNFRHMEYSSNSFSNSSKTSFMISKFLIYIYIYVTQQLNIFYLLKDSTSLLFSKFPLESLNP